MVLVMYLCIALYIIYNSKIIVAIISYVCSHVCVYIVCVYIVCVYVCVRVCVTGIVKLCYSST